MSLLVKIRMVVETGIVGGNYEEDLEIYRETWESMDKEEQEQFLNDVAIDFKNEVISCSAWVVGGDDE